MRHEAIVIGVSAGGLEALKSILPLLPASFPIPIAIVQHRDGTADDFLAEYLDKICELTVKEAEDKEPLCKGYIYLAPAGYHLLVEADKSFSLSVDDRVSYSRPSIDVLFESAADVFKDALIGIVLTGANTDGKEGLQKIKQYGGIAVVQDPETAEVATMPKAAMTVASIDHIVTLEKIAPLLVRLTTAQEG